MARKRRHPQDLVMLQLQQDEEAIKFIKLNAPYITMASMQKALKITAQHMNALVEIAGVDVTPEGKEPRAHDIEKYIGFLPLETKVEQWKRGTIFHMPTGREGVGVHVHFGMGDE